MNILQIAPVLLLTGLSLPAMAEENLARGKSYTLEPAPNSKDCAGGDAARKLTDGVFAPKERSKLNNASPTAIWMSDATAGWQHTFAPTITVDLGADLPISGLSYSTAAGVAQVSWPENIFVLTSVDGEEWLYAGDLRQLDNRPPPEEGRHQFVTRNLATHGRYVRLIPIGTPYIFSDEIEVYRGPKSLLESPPVGVAVQGDASSWAADEVEKLRPLKRIRRDVELVRQAIVSAKPVDPAKLMELDRKVKQIGDDLPAEIAFNPKSFRAILPLNQSHAGVFSAYGELLQLSGYPALKVWQKHRFDPLSYLEVPRLDAAPAKLSLTVLGNETRGDSILLTNATAKASTVAIRFEGLAPDEQKWLKVSTSLWTDTAEGVPVADALVEVKAKDSIYHVTIPAGLTTPLWVSVNGSNLSAGEYKGKLVVTEGEQTYDVPMDVKVSSVALPRPRLSLGMWDESNGTGGRGLTEKNMASAIALMRDGHVDTPWADPGVLPYIMTVDFNEDGTLNRDLDFSKLDEWIARWPDARYYAIFLNVPDEFGGSKIGDPAFSKKVGVWSLALEAHFKARGLNPSQIVLLPVDEPHTDAQDKLAEAWIKAVKASGVGFTLMTNPIWSKPQNNTNQEAITTADVVCPNLRIFTEGGAEAEKYFTERRSKGQTMWFYLCEGPVRHFDPHTYFRLQAWKAFQHDATGISFWSFGDLGGARSSWNEYAPKQSYSYAPAFLGEDDATDSIHWQAVKEGVQDYEYLALLRDALPKATAAQAQRARALLQTAVRSVLADYSTNYKWSTNAKRADPDAYREQIVRLLEEIHAQDIAMQKTPAQ